jgi:hypothetical protein
MVEQSALQCTASSTLAPRCGDRPAAVLVCRAQVVFSVQLRRIAYDGQQGSGHVLYDSSRSSSGSSSGSSSTTPPCRVQLGSGGLPEGLEAALSHMSKGERALFVLPADMMRQPAAREGSSSGGGDSSQAAQPPPPPSLPLPQLPQLPQACVQVEVTLELHDLIQVCVLCSVFCVA